MQWILAKARRLFIEGSNSKSVVGPSEVVYAADLAEDRLDTNIWGCYVLLWAVDGPVVVVALYECN
jgi:hypothetical protein